MSMSPLLLPPTNKGRVLINVGIVFAFRHPEEWHYNYISKSIVDITDFTPTILISEYQFYSNEFLI